MPDAPPCSCCHVLHARWSLIGKQRDVEATRDPAALIVTPRTLPYLNFPFDNSDIIASRVAHATKETRTVGPISHAEIFLADLQSNGISAFSLSRDRQMALAQAVCKVLTRGYAGGPTDACEETALKDVMSDFDIREFTKADVSVRTRSRV